MPTKLTCSEITPMSFVGCHSVAPTDIRVRGDEWVCSGEGS